jgi:hypothetical protein
MTKFFSCCVLFVCIACSAPTPESYWIYRGLSEDLHGPELVIDAGRETLTVGDLAVKLEICSKTEEFICFASEFLSFAVPRDLSETSAPWQFGGTEYRVLAHRDEMVLGQKVSLFILGANIEGNDLVFYFSKQRGLIALAGANRTGVPLLGVGYCGFGAAIDCRTATP